VPLDLAVAAPANGQSAGARAPSAAEGLKGGHGGNPGSRANPGTRRIRCYAQCEIFKESIFNALTIARSQSTRSLELRAARDLADLWRDQGKRDEAHDLLAPVYGWFTEGFDTFDLKEARPCSMGCTPNNQFRNGLLDSDALF